MILQGEGRKRKEKVEKEGEGGVEREGAKNMVAAKPESAQEALKRLTRAEMEAKDIKLGEIDNFLSYEGEGYAQDLDQTLSSAQAK